MERLLPDGNQHGEQATCSTPDPLPGLSEHSPPESLQCGQCGKMFHYQHRYNRHMKTHSRPYHCDMMGCVSKFALRQDLIRHQRSVHNTIPEEMRYHCEVPGCGFSFVRKDHFSRHMRTTHKLEFGESQVRLEPGLSLPVNNRAKAVFNKNGIPEDIGGSPKDHHNQPGDVGRRRTEQGSAQDVSGEKSSKIQSTTSPRADVARFWMVPFQRNTRFIGNESQLAWLEGKLFGKDATTRIAITGLGGVGKTQLVLELLYRTKEKYKDCLIIWIPATNMEALHQTYLDVARQLGIPGWEDKEVDVKRLVQEYLSKDDGGRWLLVFDNADDIEMWTAKPGSELGFSRGSGGLIDYLPRSKQGSIVFTTRDRKTAVKLAQQDVAEVPEMDEMAANQLLRRCLVNQDAVESQPKATALLTQLTYLPLAIVQAAAYINENGITIADYLSLLSDQEEDVIDLLSEEFEDDRRYRNVKNPVATTWLISFEQIQRHDRLAADYLSFMCCIDPREIPQSLLPPGPSRKKEIDAIGTLHAYSFISKRLADLTLDVHRLVHLSTRNWLRKKGLLGQWTERAIMRLKEVFPDEDHKNRSVWRRYLLHARYALKSDLVGKDWKIRMDLMRRYGTCLYEDGRWNEAENAISQVLETEKRALGVDHLDTLASIAILASTYRNQGRWDEAEELEVQVMETSKTKLGVDHPSTLTSVANLASTFWNQGRWDEAEELLIQVIETRKSKLGADHPDTLTSMGNLASTYLNQGRWVEAEELLLQVMETFKSKLGADHPDTLTSMANLASTYGNQGRWDEAEELEVQVMETSKTKLGADHPDVQTSISNLALTYLNQGRWDEAEELLLQVIETRKSKLGADHPDTLTSMGNLASTYRSQGRWDAAKELEVQVMETSKTKLGADHPSTLTSMANLASTYMSQGRWNEAEELFVQVMETSKTKLGADHPDTLTSMNNLAFTWKGQGRWSEAIRLMDECVRLQKRIVGAGHPYFRSSSTTLARWQAEQIDVDGMKDVDN